MRELKLTQGSAEWAAHRRTARNASDAPALMGASPYCSRAELIRRKATGIEPEHDNATLARFQRGHDVEPALRAFAEQIIGEDLFPVEIGRASGRERVCHDVWISVVAVSLKKKKKMNN